MTNDYEATVLFYPTGIVHYRNLELLKKELPRFRFKVIVEPWVNAEAPEVLEKINKADRVKVKGGQLPPGTWDNGVDILFLSMAYPNLFRLRMVEEAVKRNIPVVSIEEVNQLALNDGIINHYFLPIDYFGVPSDIEREKFLELGIEEESLRVTGWPFFEETIDVKNRQELKLRSFYKIPADKKCCLLVLGSLKEFDIVSLESRRVREEILETVSRGLPEYYQLLIKPHPIEKESALEDLRQRMPNAILVDPKAPIELLLDQADVVVNRGNSQVTLLAMLLNKPLAVIPVELKTIFQGPMDAIVANSSSTFFRIVDDFARHQLVDYKRVMEAHFPLKQQEALKKAGQLFHDALSGGPIGAQRKKGAISIMYAFLGDVGRAVTLAGDLENKQSGAQLKKLYSGKITPAEFRTLLEHLPSKVCKWHAQALYVRALLKTKDIEAVKAGVPYLQGFEGDVNPHYFIEDIIGRVELEYKTGRLDEAHRLFDRYCRDFSVFAYCHQAFDMLQFVYEDDGKYPGFRKLLWFLKNPTKGYTKKRIKRFLGFGKAR